MAAHWSVPFVGIPYVERGRDRDGLDCWGLVRLVLADLRGVSIPAYELGHASGEERARVAALIAREKLVEPWVPVPAGAERELDVVVIRRGRHAQHMGLVVNPRTKLMLHVERALGASRVEGYRDKAAVIEGFYRHESLA